MTYGMVEGLDSKNLESPFPFHSHSAYASRLCEIPRVVSGYHIWRNRWQMTLNYGNDTALIAPIRLGRDGDETRMT